MNPLSNGKMKAIAVDDEQHCLDTLLWELGRHCPEVEVIAKYKDPEKAYAALKDADIQILFLDIHLQSTSGIELLQRLMPVDYHVIFVTAYDEYALQAFDMAATHYLLKPINGKKLRSALDRIISSPPIPSHEKIESLIASLKKELNKFNKVPFPVQSGVEFIDPDSIVYVEGDNNYSILHFRDNTKLVISKTLSHTEKVLEEFSFLRIHKSSLINLKYIKKYHKSDGGFVEMDGGKQLPVGKTKRLFLKELFK
jgi:two-component system LytT family response regulator